ncbi:MAG TPA: hypothetical protein VLG67_03880, partial [Candidatus Saccharimonadales bacterium]|nr:hypothetical protein [Candidatus Saccharimonadales bacterium]
YMSQTGRLLPPYVKPEAFTPLQEIKEEKKSSPYEHGVIPIETYPLIKLNIKENQPEELEKFIKQIDALLRLYNTGNEPANIETEIKKIDDIKIAFLKLSSHEDKSVYFRTVKQELKTTLSELQKPFQNQFNQLLNQFREWGRIHGVNTDELETKIDTLQSNFFEASYSGSQDSSAYFKNVKKNLEKIWLMLQNDAISLTKRKEHYTQICGIFHVCAGGISIHLQNIVFSLYTPLSVTSWLVGLRTDLIQAYANIHNAEKGVSEGNSAHTEGFFARYAEDQGWSSALAMKEVNDGFFQHTKINERDLEKFHAYFEKEYAHNPTAIRACIQKNLYKAVDDIFKGFGFKIDEWNNVNKDYGVFLEGLRHILKQLDILNELDFLELNDEDTAFKLRMNHIIDMLCERVLMTSVLYYDAANKKYRELVPAFWLNLQYPLISLDISVWKSIPTQDFPSVLCRVINELSKEYIDTLLDAISYERIESMKNSKLYKEHLSFIQDSEKRASLDKKIADKVSQGEHKEEKEEKRVNPNAFYQPGTLTEIGNKILRGCDPDVESVLTEVKKNPTLLDIVITVKDPVGTPVTGTFLQLAAMAGDVNLKPNISNEKDCGLVERLISAAGDYMTPEKVAEQLKCINSDEAIDANNKRVQRYLDIIKKFGNTLCEGKVTKEEAIAQLEKELFEERSKAVNAGFIFDPRILHDTAQWFEENVNRFDGWNTPKSSVFWVNGFGK